jgi:hypothetical protein
LRIRNVTANDSLERLRETVARDLRPVRPLKPASLSALVAIPTALVLLSLLLLFYGIRSDAAAIGLWPLWGPVALMVGVAYGILYLAMKQRAPESMTSWVVWAMAPIAAVALQVGGAAVTLGATGPDPASVPWRAEIWCSWRIALLALPALLLVLWLLSRGLPLRPRVAGLLAGLDGGFLAEGIYRLYCPLSGPAHILPWHTGAVLVMGILGLLAGAQWERERLARFLEERA